MQVKLYMWQSCVEIEGYFVAYFDRIAVFEAPYCCSGVLRTGSEKGPY